jgi:hypothetical protein
MNVTAVEAQAAFPQGIPAGVPDPPPTALTLAVGAGALVGLTTVRIITGPFDKQVMRQLFLVAGPASVLTSYPGFPPQGLISRTGGFLVQVVSVTALALQGSIVALASYTLGQIETYEEGVVQRRISHRRHELIGPGDLPRQGESLSLAQGDSVRVWGELTEGSVTVDRRRWGPPVLDALQPGDSVRPGDIVIAGSGTICVKQAIHLKEMDRNDRARQLNGVTFLRPGHYPERLRRQFLAWAGTLAVGTLLLTGNVYRALGVLLAGAPAFMDVVGAASSWQETKKWERKGILPAHPLGLVAAGEVDTVLFDEPDMPGPERQAELMAAAARLQYYRYEVGLITGAPPAEAEQLARMLNADLWFSGAPADRARYVAELYRQRLVAVVGTGRESVPSMATAHLAVAEGTGGSAVAASHVALTGPLNELPEFLADSRQTGRTELHGETIARTLMIGATVAAAAGILGATSVVTVTSALALGIAGLKKLLGGSKRLKRLVAQSR